MSYVTPKKNTEFIFYVSLISQANTKIMQANATLAVGDFKVATDDGAPGNLDTIPVVDADFTKRVKVTLSADEMNGDNITLIASDAAGDEWCDLTLNIQTTVTQIDDLAPASEYDTEMGRIDVAVSTRTKPADTQAKVTLVDTVTENTDMRGTDDAATEAKQDIIDTIVDAIKLKTDTLGGAGAITWTYTITDSGTGLPIADVDVWITSDEAGTNVIATGKTDADGVATFYLDAGTIYVWRQKSGYNFTNPDTEEVTA